MVKFWIIAMIAFLVLEGITLGLTSIWFAVGSLAALLSAALGAKLWLQTFWFLFASAIALAVTRPLAKKYLNDKCEPTNADRVIGERGIVTETIDNLNATGTVSVDGKLWTARTQTDGTIIEPGTEVRIETIRGVKLIVTVIQEN